MMTSTYELFPEYVPEASGLLTLTVVPPEPSTKAKPAAMLLPSVTKGVPVTPPASAAAAVEAAESAAPCIARLVKYQPATSVPSPATPTTAVSESAAVTAIAPRQSRPRSRRKLLAKIFILEVLRAKLQREAGFRCKERVSTKAGFFIRAPVRTENKLAN